MSPAPTTRRCGRHVCNALGRDERPAREALLDALAAHAGMRFAEIDAARRETVALAWRGQADQRWRR